MPTNIEIFQFRNRFSNKMGAGQKNNLDTTDLETTEPVVHRIPKEIQK